MEDIKVEDHMTTNIETIDGEMNVFDAADKFLNSTAGVSPSCGTANWWGSSAKGYFKGCHPVEGAAVGKGLLLLFFCSFCPGSSSGA